MLKDVTLGQYFPGNSILHKLDPRMKLILSILYIVLIFLAKGVTAYALVVFFTVFLIAISKIPVRTILKSLKPLVIVLIITAFINVFWNGGTTPLFTIWKITVYQEGVIRAAAMALRIILLMADTSVILTYTTSPIALTDAIERLLSPLRVIKIPVHEFAMMMTIALRFIPTLIEETEKIMNAQKARGADFESGNLIKKAKALVPVLIPLFISSFRRAEELATAMECRCYRGGKGRTRMTVLHLKARDFLFAFFVCAVITGIVLLNVYFPVYTI